KVKKSRFIATVRSVTNEREAEAFIHGIKKEHWNARHNVYAYNIITGDTAQRYSDDGEPQGTAGIPVLEAIKRMNLTDIAVVVTRYFGGILLGAPGLVRAYGRAASAAIEKAGIVGRVLCRKMILTVQYSLSG